MTEVELGKTAFAGLMTVGIASGMLSVAAFARFSDRALARRAVDRVLANLFEFQLFSSEPMLLLRAQRDLLLSNARVLRLLLKPTLILLLPLAILFAIADTYFSRASLQIGQAAIVIAQYRAGATHFGRTELKTPSWLKVEAGPVRVDRDHEISWRIRPVRSGNGELEFSIVPTYAIHKAISAGPGLRDISDSMFDFSRFHPSFPMFNRALPSISVSYPKAAVFGWPPLFWLGVGSITGALMLSFVRKIHFKALAAGLLVLSTSPATNADTASPLFARGYTVLPQPQKVLLHPTDFKFRISEWSLREGNAHSVAESLNQGLQERFGVTLHSELNRTKHLVLDLRPGSVAPGASQDPNRNSIQAQAYQLTLNSSEVRISANAPIGLFYGVQTLLQLLKSRGNEFFLPEAEITDWPDLGLRQIYWDDAHHLETMDAFKAAIRNAAFLKINGIAIKLEGHFQFKSAPSITEPQALSPAQLQELTDYGLQHYVQVIPYLDSPAHIAFILKHPEYRSLRAFPDSNYEVCTTNPDAMALLRQMYGDLLAANRGVQYVYLSTDEAYYVGLANNSQCDEKSRADQLGSRGKVLAEFVTKLSEYLHREGREVIFWGEYPLKPGDIADLPKFVINGETYGDKFDPVYQSHGIRQMIYSSVEGEEKLFPHYYLLPLSQRIHKTEEDFPRVSDAVKRIKEDSARQSANLIGLTVAGWADMGLHNETFWLGYATVTSAGWRAFTAGTDEAMASFYELWYGPNARSMNRLYQLMSFQAQVWTDTWESVESQHRVGIWGNSEKIYKERIPAHDYVISLPPTPSNDLTYQSSWDFDNVQRLNIAGKALADNEQLLGLLDDNLSRIEKHRDGLLVFLSIARLCRENLDFLLAWRRINDLLKEAADSSAQKKDAHAIDLLDESMSLVRQLKARRNEVLHDTALTWQRTWLPRVANQDGRHFLHQVDDVKDHLPDRTIDMSYLVYREMILPVEDWYQRTQSARNAYARTHQLPEQRVPLAWGSLD